MSETAKGAAPKADDPQRKKDRSPAYPFIPLRKALERAKEFAAVEKKHSTRVAIAVKHWGFKEKSSGGLQTIAALKLYGLMEDVGSGANRQVKLSDTALRILGDERPVSPERDQLVKQAALKPKIHRDLFQQFGVDYPSHESFRTYLKLDKKFSDGALESVIKSYKDTLTYAKLAASDTIPNGGNDSEDTDQELPPEDVVENPHHEPAGQPGEKPPVPRVQPEAGEVERLRFNLKGGRRVRLFFSGHLPTQSDIQKLIANLELNKDTFPEDVPEE